RIEAAVAQAGMKYVRLRQGEAGGTVQLPPADGTAEAWRARVGHAHPTASLVVGWISLIVLLAVLGIELPQLVNLAGNLTPLIGLPSFEVPALTLSGWANLALIVLGGAAGLERSLSMKYNPLLDDCSARWVGTLIHGASTTIISARWTPHSTRRASENVETVPALQIRATGADGKRP